MTQFKDKREQQEFVSAGLFTYPVLMAATSCSTRPTSSRSATTSASTSSSRANVAERFNARYGETFACPTAMIPEVGARIMDLQEPSEEDVDDRRDAAGTVGVLDRPTTIRKKFKSAVTDSGTTCATTRREGRHLEPDRDHARHDRRRDPEIEARYDGGGLRRVQAGRRRGGRRRARSRFAPLRGAARGRAQLRELLARGADKAREVSGPTLEQMYERMGFVRP
jgi:tryptophanyl-tRNA synthetase